MRGAIAEALPSPTKFPDVARALLHALDHDADSEVRESCASSLRSMASRDETVRVKLLAYLDSREPEAVRAGAARGLSECTTANPEVRDRLLTLLTDTTEPDGVRAACLRSLEDLLPVLPKGIECVVDLLSGSSEARLPWIAALALAEYAASGRAEWTALPIEHVERVLTSVKTPCSHILDALRALTEAREVRRLGIPRERRIERALSGVRQQILTAFVFGSSARGEQGPDSDIDLMVIGDVTLKALVPGLTHAEQELGHQVNVVVYNEDQWLKLRRARDPFLMDVLKGKKAFVIGGEAELAAMAR